MLLKRDTELKKKTALTRAKQERNKLKEKD